MKYIDADKLIAEIERRMEDCKLPDGRFPTTTNIVRYEELSCLRNFITSLQQEQPEIPGYDKALLEVKSKVDELYEKASIGLNEYDSGLYNGIAETCMKLRGFIKARLGSNEQPEGGCSEKPNNLLSEKHEWPEMDLEKIIGQTYHDGSVADTSDMDLVDYENIARHFYELGLNARKEE